VKFPPLIPTLALICSLASAQSVRTHELGLVVDNDYPYMTDQYYTAGQDLYYRFLLKSRNGQPPRSVLSLHYGNKIFTPKNVDTDDPKMMDRPYCGWNFISGELRTLPKANVSNLFALQVGIVGRESGMGQLQQWLHQAINLYGIEGWGYQIANETVVNANFSHTRSFTITEHAELVSSSSVWAGTGNNRLSQELTVRLFNFNPITTSSFLNANIASHSTARKHELFLFATLGGDYIFSNIFFEGSLFKNNPSPRTTSINPWLFSQKLGIQYAGNKFSLGISIVHVGRENNLVTPENYASGNVAYRF
jgi:lipid A 3-O-deacylase